MRRHHAERSAGFVERAEDAGALGRGVHGQGMCVLGIGNTFVDLFGVSHPVAQFVDGGPVVGQQVGKDGAGVGEEEWLAVGAVREETFSDRQGLSFVVSLFTDGPVRTALVGGIKDDVAAGGVVKLSEVLAVGIVNDGSIAALFDLVEDGADQGGFTRTGVARDLNVVRFFGPVENEIASA